VRLRRTLGIGVALLLLPGSASRAAEEDLSFFTAIGAGVFMLVGAGLCFATSDEPSEYARTGPYVGLGASYATENFQQKGGVPVLNQGQIGQPGNPPPPTQPLYDVFDRTPQQNRFFGPPYQSFTGPIPLPTPVDVTIQQPTQIPIPLNTPPYIPLSINGDGPPSRFLGADDDPGPTGGRCGGIVPLTGRPIAGPDGLPCVSGPGTFVVQTAGGPFATNFRSPLSQNFDAQGNIIAFPMTNLNTPNVYTVFAYGADEPGPWRVTDGDSLGINGRAGYRCHPRAAHEFHFEWLADAFDITGSTIGYTTTGSYMPDPSDPSKQIFFPTAQFVERVRRVTSTVELWTMGANTKLFLRKERIQPYVLGGLGVMRVDEQSVRELVSLGGVAQTPQYVDSSSFRDVDITARIGGGIDVYVTKNLVFTLEGSYVRPTGRAEPYDYVSAGAGIQWRFSPGKSED